MLKLVLTTMLLSLPYQRSIGGKPSQVFSAIRSVSCHRSNAVPAWKQSLGASRPL
jgi:hypothetical protein